MSAGCELVTSQHPELSPADTCCSALLGEKNECMILVLFWMKQSVSLKSILLQVPRTDTQFERPWC